MSDIEKYIKIYKKINKLNIEINRLRLLKLKYSKRINKHFGEHNELIYNNYKLKLYKNNEYQNISKKYLNSVLSSYFNDPNKVNNIIDFIYKNRFTKIKYNIKII